MTNTSESPLRRARKAAGKTTVEVASALGVDQSTISRVERCEQRATPALAEQLSRYLGTVSEIEILYPERYVAAKPSRKGRAA